MLTKRDEQFYRFFSEGTISLVTSPFLVQNALQQMPSLFYPILPLYYLADAIGYSILKPSIRGDDNVDTTFTFTNRLTRNAKHFAWNVISSYGCSFVAATAGMPAATLAFSLIVIAKCATESRYLSNEKSADMLEDNGATRAVVTTPYMR